MTVFDTLLSGLRRDSPMDKMAMLAQLGQTDPNALAAIMAETGAEPPPITAVVAPSPTVGALAAAQTGGPNNPGSAVPTLNLNPRLVSPFGPVSPGAGSEAMLPSVAPTPTPFGGGGPDAATMGNRGTVPSTLPAPAASPQLPGASPEAAGTDPAALLQALAAVQPPPNPTVPQPPRALLPGSGGTVNPQLMQVLASLVGAGNQAPAAQPTLGQLIRG